MPVQVRFSEDGTHAVFHCRGQVTGVELVGANREIYAPLRLKNLRTVVVDYSAADWINIGSDDVHMIARMHTDAAILRPCLRAAVVAPDDLPYGLSRMWNALVEEMPLQTKVCRTRPEAEKWLQSTEKQE